MQMIKLLNQYSKPLAIASTIGILIVVMAGALVTKTGSAEGCGANWPLCYDEWIPSSWNKEKIIEYSHRLLTGVVGILILVFSLFMAFQYRRNQEILWVSMASLFFLFLQSALGAITVVGYGQSSTIKALHFGFSILSYASVFLLAVYVYQLDKRSTLPALQAGKRLKSLLVSLFIYSYIVVYLGAYVRHTGSGGGCQGWPLCNGQVIPELSGTVGIHFMHRVAALLLLIGFIWLFTYVRNHYKQDRILYRASASMLLLIIFQIMSGGLMVLSRFNTWISLSHAFFICIMFGVLSYCLLYAFRSKDLASTNHIDSNKTGIPN